VRYDLYIYVVKRQRVNTPLSKRVKLLYSINPFRTEIIELYLKIKYVPQSKHPESPL
jgi:hypothetical protein